MTTSRVDHDGWLPIAYGDQAVLKYQETSAVEANAKTFLMPEAAMNVPRFSNFAITNVAKGALYTFTEGVDDRIDLLAKKFGGIVKVANEDLNDLQADVLQVYRTEGLGNMAIQLDNSCLGVSAAKNTTTIKFDSVYRTLRTAPTSGGVDEAMGYTADANYLGITTSNFQASGSGKGYDTLSDLLAKYETSRFYDPSKSVVIANPAFMGLMRKMKNSFGDPLMSEMRDPLGQPTYQVFGYPVKWTFGARTSAVDTENPTGHPLLFIVNRDMLLLGKRALAPDIPADTFGVAFQPSAQGDGFDSDESKLKVAGRRAFALATAKGAAVIEVTDA